MTTQAAAITSGKLQPRSSLGAHPERVAEPAGQSAPDLFHEKESQVAGGPVTGPAAAIKEEPTSLDQLRRFAASGYLFALLDATDQILVPHKAKLLGPTKAVSLFTGTANEWHWAVAPYLFHVDSELLDWIAEKLWKEPWGIFAMSKANLEELRLHFKKFLMVQLPDGKPWLFRYYDPRILQVYLPTCEPRELQKFFGPVRAFATADNDEQKLMMLPGTPQGMPEQPRSYSQAGMFWAIRPEQHQAFTQAAEESFVERSIKFLQEKLPDQVGPLPPEVLRPRVEAGIARARKHQMTWQSSLLTFLTLMFEVGPNFDEHPMVRQALARNRMNPNDKMRGVLTSLSRREWTEIREFAKTSSWKPIAGI